MGRQLTLELPDDLYEPLAKSAKAVGQSLDEWLIARLRPLAQRPVLSEEEKEAAMAELMAFAGCVNSGNPNAADNEAIDSDLARTHGNTHEEQPQMPNFEVALAHGGPNAEYPWETPAGTVHAPATYRFALSNQLRTPKGIKLLTLITIIFDHSDKFMP